MAVYRAVKSFTGRDGRVIRRGDLVDDRGPEYRGREHFFELAARPGRRASAVEEATAEPNARRTLGCPRGRR